MRSKLILWSFIFFIGLAILLHYLTNTNSYYQLDIDAYRKKAFYGIITEKHLDKDNHNYKTININQNGKIVNVSLESEIGGLFHYLKLGDSIIKENGNLFVEITRRQLDTTIFMKFYSNENYFYIDSTNYNIAK